MFKCNSKRWNRKEYPPNWEELARACKEAAHWRCQHCKVKQGTERISKAGKPYHVRLAACHANHFDDKSNPNPILLCLCERCHAWYDAPYKAMKRMIKHEIDRHRILLAKKGIRVA